MKYIGCVNPFVPVNAFMESVYSDEEGKLYTHELEYKLGKARIIKFETLDLEMKDVKQASETIPISLQDQPIYSFLSKNSPIHYGTFDELFTRFVFYLNDEANDHIARILVASFFTLHGKTVPLINLYKGPSVISLKARNFLPSRHATYEVVPQLIENISEKIEKIKLTCQLNYKDFIFIGEGFIYIDRFQISFESIARFVDIEDASSKYRLCLLDLFVEYKAFSGPDSNTCRYLLNEKSLLGLGDLVKKRELSHKYGVHIPEQTAVVELSYQTEGKISDYARQHTGITRNLERLRAMRDKVKKIMKKQYYAINSETKEGD